MAPSFPSPSLLPPSLHLPRRPRLLACLCVRCARTSKISICSFIQSRSGGGGGATCVHFSSPAPAAAPFSLPLSPTSLPFHFRPRKATLSFSSLLAVAESYLCVPSRSLHAAVLVFVRYITVANSSALKFLLLQHRRLRYTIYKNAALQAVSTVLFHL